MAGISNEKSTGRSVKVRMLLLAVNRLVAGANPARGAKLRHPKLSPREPLHQVFSSSLVPLRCPPLQAPLNMRFGALAGAIRLVVPSALLAAPANLLNSP